MKAIKYYAAALFTAMICLASCAGKDAQKAEEANIDAVNAADELEAVNIYNDIAKGIVEVSDNKIDAPAATPYIMDFNATWCGPCREFHPVFAKAAKDYEGKLTFYSVDVDENVELAEMYQIEAIPTVVGINANGDVFSQTGYMDSEALNAFIAKVLK